MPAELAGQQWTPDLLKQLPDSADPCGENGEFHTFVSAGPMLQGTIAIEAGKPFEKNGFMYCDLFPAGSQGE